MLCRQRPQSWTSAAFRLFLKSVRFKRVATKLSHVISMGSKNNPSYSELGPFRDLFSTLANIRRCTESNTWAANQWAAKRLHSSSIAPSDNYFYHRSKEFWDVFCARLRHPGDSKHMHCGGGGIPSSPTQARTAIPPGGGGARWGSKPFGFIFLPYFPLASSIGSAG